MKRKVYGGTTSFLDRVFIRDTSVTTRVAGLTGLVYNSAGLTWYWCRAGDSTATAVSLVTATVGTWTSGGFKEIDATHMPGWYELGTPNAAVAAGAALVGMHLRGATNMEDVPIQIELDVVNYQSQSFNLLLAKTTNITGFNDIAAPTGFAAATFPTTVASPTNITAATGITLAANQHVIVDSGTVTTLTNLPAITANWLTDTGIDATAVTKLQAGLSTYAGGDTSGVTTLLTRLSAARSGYLDNLSAGAVMLASSYSVPPSAASIAAAVLTDTTDTTTANSLGFLIGHAPGWYAAASQASANAIKIVTDQLATALQDDGASGWQFTTLALAKAPSGGGGGSDDPYMQARIYGPVDPLDSQGRQVFRSPPNADDAGTPKVRLGPTSPRGGRTVELDPSV